MAPGAPTLGAPASRPACGPEARAPRGSALRADAGGDAGGPRAGAHWTTAYLGWRGGDCADLVVAALAEVWGLDLRLPAHASGVRARDRQIAALAGDLARRLDPDEAPREGDGVLMRAAGRARVAGHHIGLWTAAPGEPGVLHCLAGAGVCLHRLRDLRARGLEATGVYRWK